MRHACGNRLPTAHRPCPATPPFDWQKPHATATRFSTTKFVICDDGLVYSLLGFFFFAFFPHFVRFGALGFEHFVILVATTVAECRKQICEHDAVYSSSVHNSATVAVATHCYNYWAPVCK